MSAIIAFKVARPILACCDSIVLEVIWYNLTFQDSASILRSLPDKVSPMPKINFMVSNAWIDPNIPGKGLSTPPSEQEGIASGGGAPGYKER